MKGLILIALVMTLFSPLIHAYNYDDQRRRQARDSGQQALKEPKQKQTQSIKQKNKIAKQKTEQRRQNRKKLRLGRKMGLGNYPGNNSYLGPTNKNSNFNVLYRGR